MSEERDETATVREGAELGPRTMPTRPEERRLERGEAVGRYLVVDVVGEGGMGVVYAAYDPELDRKVAIKLLQARPAGETRGDQAWLMREAQAMARLSHPNVIAVYDVGTVSSDRVFVAMELVEGQTLRQWMRGVRTPAEVATVMREAGAGLAAAHAAGLVHRDFKPDNVLVGADGRVRVMDFGLARLREEGMVATLASRQSDVAIPSKSPLTASIELDNAVAGTPVYMAPEIHRGSPANAASDQFAFGVALYEGLFRARPYDRAALVGSTPPVLPTPPAMPAVTTKLRQAALRAIAPDPAARYPSMDALIADLAPPPVRSRAAIGIGVGIAAVGAAIAVVVLSRGSAPDPCQSDRLAGVWDDHARDATRAAFLATKSPFAIGAYDSVAHQLDAYAAIWVDSSTQSCQATLVRHEQPEDAMALRAGCFAQRREELRALAALLATADASLVEKASRAAASLEPISRCDDVAALRAPGLPSAEIAAKLDGLRGQLASAKALLVAGQTKPALAAAETASAAAAVVGWAPAIAEAELVRGRVLLQAGKYADAAPVLAAASWAGERGRRDDVTAEAALFAAQAASEGLGNDAIARVWLGLGDAAAQRTGDRTLDLRRLEVAGIVAGAHGDFKDAVAAHEKALAAAEKLGDTEALGRVENLLAATHAKLGAWGDALPHYERALALREAAVGKEHPDVAVILSAAGACYDHMGDDKRALASFGRALAIREAAFGAKSPRLVVTLNNLADFQRRKGSLDDATATIERAFAIAAVQPGTTHPLYHTVATTRGEVLAAAGKRAEARTALDEAIALEEANKSSALPDTLASRADLAAAGDEWGDATGFAERAIALMEAAGGKDAAGLWRPLVTLARAQKATGDGAGAKQSAARAIAIGRAAKVSDAELGPALALQR